MPLCGAGPKALGIVKPPQERGTSSLTISVIHLLVSRGRLPVRFKSSLADAIVLPKLRKTVTQCSGPEVVSINRPHS